MRIYFVRHGESVSNAGRVGQGPTAALSEMGRKQSEFLAERLSKLPIEAIIASPYERTKETAEIIAEKIKKPIEWSELFVERKKPSELIGKSFDDPLRREIFDLARGHADDPAWRYSDEENFFDLKARAETALTLITTRSEANLLVVTHGMFKRLLVGSMIFGKDFGPLHYDALRSFLTTANTGITVCDLLTPDDEHPEPRWKLITWNDHAHLG